MNVKIELNECSVMVDAWWNEYSDLTYDVLAVETCDGIELDCDAFKAEFDEELQSLVESALQAECERQEVARLDHESEMRSYARTNGGW